MTADRDVDLAARAEWNTAIHEGESAEEWRRVAKRWRQRAGLTECALRLALPVLEAVSEAPSDHSGALHASRLAVAALDVEGQIDAVDDTDPDGGPGPVLAATYWPTNGHMVEALHRLGYLAASDHVLDPTFENGIWWQRWRPERLTTCHRATDGTDFRHLPFEPHTFDAVAFDPPYVCPGGRKTSTIPEFHQRFGMAEGGHEDPLFSNPAELQQLINDGLTEMVRLVKPKGLILTKCQDYVWGGRLWEGATMTRNHAVELGCSVEDRLEFLTRPRPQPATIPDGSDRRQVHARRNLSTLFVFRTPNVDTRQGVLL